MPKIDLHNVEGQTGTSYPAPYDMATEGRTVQRLSEASGLTQFGANLVTLDPGAQSALRHHHVMQDEFAMVTVGELTLIDDNGETPLQPGDCVAFPAGDDNGHHIVNKSERHGSFLVIGTRTETETAYYPDHDLMVTSDNGKYNFTRKDGSAL